MVRLETSGARQNIKFAEILIDCKPFVIEIEILKIDPSLGREHISPKLSEIDWATWVTFALPSVSASLNKPIYINQKAGLLSGNS